MICSKDVTEDTFWSVCVGMSMVGAATLTGHNKSSQTDVMKVASHVNFTKHSVHRGDFSSHDQLHIVLREAVKVAYYAKTRPLNSNLFAVLWDEIQAH